MLSVLSSVVEDLCLLSVLSVSLWLKVSLSVGLSVVEGLCCVFCWSVCG